MTIHTSDDLHELAWWGIQKEPVGNLDNFGFSGLGHEERKKKKKINSKEKKTILGRDVTEKI